MTQRRDLATWTKIFHLLRVISDKMRAGDGGPGQQRPDGGLRLDLLLAAARPWMDTIDMDGRSRSCARMTVQIRRPNAIVSAQ